MFDIEKNSFKIDYTKGQLTIFMLNINVTNIAFKYVNIQFFSAPRKWLIMVAHKIILVQHSPARKDKRAIFLEINVLFKLIQR